MGQAKETIYAIDLSTEYGEQEKLRNNFLSLA